MGHVSGCIGDTDYAKNHRAGKQQGAEEFIIEKEEYLEKRSRKY